MMPKEKPLPSMRPNKHNNFEKQTKEKTKIKEKNFNNFAPNVNKHKKCLYVTYERNNITEWKILFMLFEIL